MSVEWIEIGPCRIACGDCLEILPTLEPGSVDAVVTDPPYGVDLTERVTKHTRRKASIRYDDDSAAMDCVIERVRKVIGIGVPTAITPGIRNLFLYPEPTDIGCVYFPNGAGRGRWGFTQFNPVLYYGKNPTGFSVQSSQSQTHWLSETVDHPCPKPVPWMKWMVEKTSLEGQCVLDPFMGSGTTGVACIRTGRKFIGIEKEEKYFQIARKRLERAWQDKCSELPFEPEPQMVQRSLLTDTCGDHNPASGREGG